MPHVEGLRSPYDKTVGGLHHLGRMMDKMRLKQAGKLPEDFQRNYGLGPGLDGLLCGMLGVKFEAVEARVHAGGADAEIAEWVFTTGLRPNRTQTYIWNEFSRKVGWNDRVTAYLQNTIKEAGFESSGAITSLDFIEVTEGRVPPPAVTGKG
jgi:hypothetical protein